MNLQAAVAHHLAGRLAEAAQAYAQVIELEPDNADALHMLGRVVSDLGDHDMALTLIAEACRIRPGQLSYLLTHGLVLMRCGRSEAAIACYTDALALYPNLESVWFGLGNAHDAAGNAAEAERCFEQALCLRESFFEARYNLANLQKARGALAIAIEHYQHVVVAAPDFGDAFHNLGSALQAAGRADEALAIYTQALRFDWPETHNNIGTIHLARAQYPAALQCFQRALALKPEYAEAANNAGNAYVGLARLSEAEASFREALSVAPDYGVAHLNLADLLLARDDFAAAISEYELAARDLDVAIKARFQIGIVHARMNALDAALACFQAVAAHTPEHLDAHFNLGVVYGRKSDAAAAERCYREVLRQAPAHVDAHINLSALLRERGQVAEARQHIEAAYSQRNVFVRPAPQPKRTVLILFDVGKGNINLTHLFDEHHNTLIDWMIEYAGPEQWLQLPHYDVVFNAMGDADVTGDIAVQVRRFLEVCRVPLLNPPDQVAKTARHELPALLAGVTDIVVAPMWRCVDGNDWAEVDVSVLPILTRPVDTHGGIGMTLLHTVDEITDFCTAQRAPAYVTHFVDYRSADGYYRKYRVFFVDREPYPYHLAISKHWIVHYFSAEMMANDWKLAEERAFLDDPESVVGASAMQAIRAIGRRLDLDYAGMDFSILPDGRLLVFEANPTMLAHPEDPHGPLAYKNSSVTNIFAAFEALLARRSRKG